MVGPRTAVPFPVGEPVVLVGIGGPCHGLGWYLVGVVAAVTMIGVTITTTISATAVGLFGAVIVALMDTIGDVASGGQGIAMILIAPIAKA